MYDFSSAKKPCTAGRNLYLNPFNMLSFFPLAVACCFSTSTQATITFSKRQLSFFSHAISSFILPKGKKVKNIANSDQVINSQKFDWKKILIYSEALLHNLEDRFYMLEMLCAFYIVDTKGIPLDANPQQLYENHDVKLLIIGFNDVSVKQILKIVNDYQTLKDRVIMPEFDFCWYTGAVCSKIIRDEIF